MLKLKFQSSGKVNPGKYGQGVNTDRCLTIHMFKKISL